MYRRRRNQREIAFSFDSFLDLVTNIIGIVIRLILVAWVGARSYSTMMEWKEEEPPPAALAVPTAAEDPLSHELVQTQKELDQARAQLVKRMRKMNLLRDQESRAKADLEKVAGQKQDLQRQAALLYRTVADKENQTKKVAFSLAELRGRAQNITEQIRALENQPIQKKVLRFRTPVSQPVQADELFFECKAGRVTFIDLPAFLNEIQRSADLAAERLKNQWEFSDATPPVGPFRLRFTMARQRDPLDALGAIAPPSTGPIRYGLAGWVVEPIASHRGESLEEALAPHSAFRNLVDRLDGQQTVVTLWVYPDSFGLFRELRNYLYSRELEVAGRPLPEEAPIAASRHGTVSRGQ